MSENQRQEIAEVIASRYDDKVGQGASIEFAECATDELLQLGYRKPRTITTAGELDALPVRSVILAANGEPFIAHNYDRRDGKKKLWSTGGATAGAFDSEWFTKPLIGAGLPATVLHEPEAAK